MPAWPGVSAFPPRLNCTMLSDCCRLVAEGCWGWGWEPGWVCAAAGSAPSGRLTLGAGCPACGAGSRMPPGGIAGPPGPPATGMRTLLRGPTMLVGAPVVGHCIPRDSYARLISGALGFCVCGGACGGFVTAIKHYHLDTYIFQHAASMREREQVLSNLWMLAVSSYYIFIPMLDMNSNVDINPIYD